MIKKIVIGMCLFIPYASADWIDDLAHLVYLEGDLDQLKAEQNVQKYIEKDEQEIIRLEEKLKANDEDGFWPTVRGGTYQMQWAAAKTRLRYHKKVFDFIKGLPKNQNDRQNLIHHLNLLKQHEQELEELKQRYNTSSGWADSLKAGSLIAAKQLHIRGRKALIKSSFII